MGARVAHPASGRFVERLGDRVDGIAIGQGLRRPLGGQRFDASDQSIHVRHHAGMVEVPASAAVSADSVLAALSMALQRAAADPTGIHRVTASADVLDGYRRPTGAGAHGRAPRPARCDAPVLDPHRRTDAVRSGVPRLREAHAVDPRRGSGATRRSTARSCGSRARWRNGSRRPSGARSRSRWASATCSGRLVAHPMPIEQLAPPAGAQRAAAEPDPTPFRYEHGTYAAQGRAPQGVRGTAPMRAR